MSEIKFVTDAINNLAGRIRRLESAPSPRLPYIALDNAVRDGVTDDTVIIKDAVSRLDAISAPGMRYLYFPPGDYVVSEIIDLPRYINISGSGPTATRIKLKEGTTLVADAYGEPGIFRFKNDGVNNHHVQISDLMLYGNNANGSVSHGLVMYGVQQQCTIRNVYASDCAYNGFYIHQGSALTGGLCLFESCWALDNDLGGWWIGACYNTFISCHGESSSALGAGNYHFNITLYGNTFIGCRGESSEPIFYLESAANTFINCNGSQGPAAGALFKMPATATGESGLQIINAWNNGGFLYTLQDDINSITFADNPLNYRSNNGVFVGYTASSTVTGWSAFTYKLIEFNRSGNKVLVNFKLEGTSDANSVSFTLPYTCGMTAAATMNGICRIQDNGGSFTIGIFEIATGTNIVSVYPTLGGGAWTASGDKKVTGQLWYEIA